MKKRSKSNLGEAVMKQIQTGKISMRPKAHFIWLAVATSATVVLASLTIAYLFSIGLLWMRIQSADTMARGARNNLAESISNFPWWIAIAATLLLIAAVVMVRKYSHLYKYRLSELILVIVLASLILGMVFTLFDIGRPHMPTTPGERGFGQGRMRNF